MKPIPHQRHLFDILHSGRQLSLALAGRGHQKVYLGYINGSLAYMGRTKGHVLRALIQVARTFPKFGFEPEVVRHRNCH